MIYLDYAANYPCKKEVLEALNEVELHYIGNYNSDHGEGRRTQEKYEELQDQIYSLLHLSKEEYEIIHTSSATESNNMAIKGIARAYSGDSSFLLCSPFEHSSTNAALAYLKDQGDDIQILKATKDGKLDLADLKEKLQQKPLLTVVSYVDSELGTLQDVHRINEMIHESGEGYLLVDATQAMGKFDIDFNGLDMVSFAPHKFGGLIGTGVLIKRRDIVLTPLLHGGRSLSLYRASTPAIGFVASTEKAIEIALSHREENFQKVKELAEYLVKGLKDIKGAQINSFPENPYIINISLEGHLSKDVVSYLDSKGICVSQKSACSVKNTPSKVINAIYHDKKRALSSFRISLSDLTTKEELDTLLSALGEYQHE